MTHESENNSIDELYKDVILDHYHDPRHSKLISEPTVVSEGKNPICGDEISLTIKVNEQDFIQSVGVNTTGCCISIASGSMMAEHIEGMSVERAKMTIEKFKKMMNGGPVVESESGDFEALSGISKFPVRIKCALLSWVTLSQALDQNIEYRNTVATTELNES
jgi:nitrogen fixation protein NifU and related proteins